jgi:hypothetical protein
MSGFKNPFGTAQWKMSVAPHSVSNQYHPNTVEQQRKDTLDVDAIHIDSKANERYGSVMELHTGLLFTPSFEIRFPIGDVDVKVE